MPNIPIARTFFIIFFTPFLLIIFIIYIIYKFWPCRSQTNTR
ncbi:MAG: hypothetical protein DRN25_05695 [Thermoplasmata archaeon]|nr:MAG: hypothetical protein DRN25_05695 [Thermoplasmata archaeon]